jgi:hypothetical protein
MPAAVFVVWIILSVVCILAFRYSPLNKLNSSDMEKFPSRRLERLRDAHVQLSELDNRLSYLTPDLPVHIPVDTFTLLAENITKTEQNTVALDNARRIELAVVAAASISSFIASIRISLDNYSLVKNVVTAVIQAVYS